MLSRYSLPFVGGGALIVLVIVAACGDETGPYEHPSPVLEGIEPARVGLWGSTLSITLHGRGFSDIAEVRVDGQTRPSTWLDDTTLELHLGPADLSTLGTRLVQVWNPAPGGGTSGVGVFEVVAPVVDPMPVLDSVRPAALYATGEAAEVVLYGHGFVPRSILQIERGGVRLFEGDGRFVSLYETRLMLRRGELDRGGRLALKVINNVPGSGSSVSAERYVDVINPPPQLAWVHPTRVLAGSPPPQIGLHGTGFTAVTSVRVNGRPRPVVWNDATSLTLQLAEEDVRSAGELFLALENPEPGGGLSQGGGIDVYGEIPVLERLPISGIRRGAGDTELLIHGEHFTEISTARVDGSARATRYLSSTRLAATLPASDLATVGTLGISVETPALGASPELPFRVAAADPLAIVSQVVVPLPATDLRFVPATGLLYATVPASPGPLGAIHAVDPGTGALLASTALDGGPDRLAVSTDGTLLWVALDSVGALLPVDLPALAPGTPFPLGGYEAVDIAALPGLARTVAVAARDPAGHYGAVRIYDDGVRRVSMGRHDVEEHSIAFTEDGTRLVAYEPGRGPAVYGVEAGGLYIERLPQGSALDAVGASYVNGLMIDSRGGLWDARETELLADLGSSDDPFHASYLLEPGSGVALALVRNVLELWDLHTSQLLGQVAVPSAVWSHEVAPPRLVAWGPDGVAFSDRERIHVLRLSGLGR